MPNTHKNPTKHKINKISQQTSSQQKKTVRAQNVKRLISESLYIEFGPYWETYVLLCSKSHNAFWNKNWNTHPFEPALQQPALQQSALQLFSLQRCARLLFPHQQPALQLLSLRKPSLQIPITNTHPATGQIRASTLEMHWERKSGEDRRSLTKVGPKWGKIDKQIKHLKDDITRSKHNMGYEPIWIHLESVFETT